MSEEDKDQQGNVRAEFKQFISALMNSKKIEIVNFDMLRETQDYSFDVLGRVTRVPTGEVHVSFTYYDPDQDGREEAIKELGG
jgi:hypothetical protein